MAGYLVWMGLHMPRFPHTTDAFPGRRWASARELERKTSELFRRARWGASPRIVLLNCQSAGWTMASAALDGFTFYS